MSDNLSSRARELLGKLAEISRRGPVPAVGTGDTSVGMTLLELLDVPYSSTSKPAYDGIVLSARRGTRTRDSNRVNLFAKVPDWTLSECKSSREILNRFGYERDGDRKLYCTVRARQPNSQGLVLTVDREAQLLRENHVATGGDVSEVAAWRLVQLEQKLLQSHAESAWIVAVPSLRDGREFFHFRFAVFTAAPRADELVTLLEQGTITMDHLIWEQGGRVVEKGPLFKIHPDNASALFPVSPRIDLLSL